MRHPINCRCTIPSLDFIAGYISANGSFFVTQNGSSTQHVFQIKVHKEDYPILKAVRDKLKLSEKIHEYSHGGRNYVLLLIRSKKTIQHTLAPKIGRRLCGPKAKVFRQWIKTLH